MLKVRLMGIRDRVTEFSEMYPNKGTKKFYRAYVEVKKRNVAEK